MTQNNLWVWVRRGKRVLREKGFLAFVKEASLATVKSVFCFETLCILESTLARAKDADLRSEIDNLTLNIISTQHDLGQFLAEGYDFSSYPNIAEDRERLDRGAVLFCVFAGRELTHRSWVAMSPEASGGVYPFPADYQVEGTMGGVRTTAKYQGKGINSYVALEIVKYLAQRGIARAKSATRKDNLAYQRSLLKIGSKIIGEGYHLRLLMFWDIWWLKSRKAG